MKSAVNVVWCGQGSQKSSVLLVEPNNRTQEEWKVTRLSFRSPRHRLVITKKTASGNIEATLRKLAEQKKLITCSVFSLMGITGGTASLWTPGNRNDRRYFV